MQGLDTDWTTEEKAIAQKAFQSAYEREISALVSDVKTKMHSISGLDDLWQVHDYLSARRHDIDGKYDYRYSVLIFVFSQLVREGWLHLDDLDGLDPSKLKKVTALSRM
ncbi:MAG: hypothetical protein EA367_19490 [Leptolyngbya sp. DLM2.Bin15]|nr:MAG: hypothetical protein EA367_19490 [Leptolyngbya sp. DLM2.Bin15]